MKEKTCCFTGHRPKSLPWKYKENGKEFKIFSKELTHQIELFINNGYEYFISGMAIGVDLISAEIILKLKKKHPNIKLECAVPCLDQTKGWEKSFINRYNKVIKKADKTTYVSNTHYFNGCMQKRNKYMVDNSSALIAVYDGKSPGGTKQTIDYAKSKQLQTIIIINV